MKTLMLKFFAIIFGCTIWYIFSQSRQDTISINVPLCFYNTEKIKLIESPDNIRVTLSGTRQELINMDIEHLAAHIDASKLNVKSADISIESYNLFLPTTIKLVHYNPAPIPVHVTLQDNQL